MSEARKAAARDAQTILKITQNPQLKVDGIVGRETRSTYAQSSGDAQRVVASVVKRHGLSMTELLSPTARISRPRKGTPDPQVVALISKWASLHRVSPRLATTICGIESNFDVNARSPTGASGLFQVTASAVADVRKGLPGMYYEPPGGNRLDPEWNTMVGIGYIKLAARYAGKDPQTDSLSDWAEIYSTYNLGPGAFRLWKAGEFSNSRLVNSWSVQSAELKQNGIENYISNVTAKLSSLA